MKRLLPAFLLPFFLLPIAGVSASDAVPTQGAATAEGSFADNWQMRRLMEPTPAELARETAGEVVIYDRLTDKQVDAAMSSHPERIRNMMFLGTIITDEQGEAKVDDYGMFAMEDDGC